MFFDEYLANNKNIKRILKTSGTFEAGYDYWSNYLTERVLRLFKWNGPDDDGVPQRELEIALMLGGSCGVTDKYKKTLSVFSGQYAGEPTQYYDVYKKYSVYSPVFSAVLTIGKNVIVGRNNNVMNSVMPLIHRYAMMLAHTEVSIVDVLIDGRTSSVPIASTEAQKQSITNYRNALCNGKITPILDPAFSGVQFIDLKGNIGLQLKDLVETRENLLNAFYSDIGVKTAWNKKGNMIQEEVEASDSLMLFNINDMLECRKTLCKEVNEFYGTNWSVDITDELKQKEVGADEKEGRPDNTLETE